MGPNRVGCAVPLIRGKKIQLLTRLRFMLPRCIMPALLVFLALAFTMCFTTLGLCEWAYSHTEFHPLQSALFTKR
jgi:hypothetical protein